MALRIDAGWDFAIIGEFTLVLADIGAPATITYTSGSNCHTDITAVDASFDDFATRLQTSLNAAVELSGTYTVTWNTDVAFGYRITSTEDWEIDASTNALARNILGIATSGAVSASSKVVDSTRRPYYVISSRIGAASQKSDDYELAAIAEDAYSANGDHYGVHTGVAPVLSDFVLTYETKAAVFEREATASVPWTYQHLWKHCRNVQPFLVVDDAESTVHRLRAEGAAFGPRRVTADYDDEWDLSFQTVMVGRL